MNKIKFFFDTLKSRSVVVSVSLSALLSNQCGGSAVKSHKMDSKSAPMETVPLIKQAVEKEVKHSLTDTEVALHQAVDRIEQGKERHGDYMRIEGLLKEEGTNPDSPDAKGRRALIKLIEDTMAKYSIARLVNEGADFDTGEGNGRTAFHCVTNPRKLTFGHVSEEDIAALKKDESVLNIIVEFMVMGHEGASARRSQRGLSHISEFVNSQEKEHGTVPLHWAATFSKKMLELLTWSSIGGDVGASVHKVDHAGNNALHYCVQHPIINSGVSVFRQELGNTVKGRLKVLLDFMPSACKNCANKEGHTVSINSGANKEGHTVCINCANKEWNTPLHLAVLTGQKDVYDFLIKKGALSTIKNKEGKSADDLRKEKGWK